MAKVIDNFGKNAGKVWNTLEKNGSMTPNKIMKKTRLNDTDFYAAIGWLARENKIHKKGQKYHLGETNLENKIGKTAGVIWDTLEKIGYIDEPYIPKITGYNKRETYCALGWLAREGKINAKRVKPKKPTTKYGVKKN